MSSKTPFVAAAPAASVRTVASAATAPRAAIPEPTQDEIAVRAFELFLQEGGIDGRDLEHWLRAEEELKTRKKS